MMQQLDEALNMLDTFASVRATHFDLTHTNIDGEKRGFRPRQSLAQLKNSLPKLFPGAARKYAMQSVLVLNGDSYCEADLRGFRAFHGQASQNSGYSLPISLVDKVS